MKRLGVLTMIAVAMACTTAPAQAITLPAGFTDELVTTLASPTAIASTPDGRVLVTTQPGALRVVMPNGALLATPALNLAGKACANSERGLLGVAVDPAFSVNRYIYLFYTFNRSGSCATNSSQGAVNRVSRFTLADSNVVSPITETVLVDNMPSWAGNHNGGDVQFGKDGNLYVSIGDGGCDYAGGGCAGANDAARDEHVLVGKILRITPSGAIPPDNPFRGAGTARCNVTGRTSPGMRCQETYAWGLRNPFRIAVDPNAVGTRLYINDVGQNAWEEIDAGAPGADYGWNVREGHCVNGTTTNCGPPPTGMTNPIFDYGRSDGCGSITGGAFVPAGIWPASYGGTYLFGDYVCGRIFQLVPNATGGFRRVTFADGLGSGSAVHLAFGPSGGGRALLYTTYAGGGSLRRIVYAGAGANRTPTADVTASPVSGAVPLTVNLNGSASRDPDPGDTLTYLWSFGDGTAATQTAGPATSHVYRTAGTFTATLRVRDARGATSAPDTVRIDAGNTPPRPVIQLPAAGQRFAVRERILLRGSATDTQDGTLPASALRWTVLRRHATHTHPYLGPVAGNAQSFIGPAPEDLAATTNSSIEVRLTATDSRGASATVTRIILPKIVKLTFATSPSTLKLSLNGTVFTAPRTWSSWQGWDVTVNALDDSRGWIFRSWSDGGARSHVIRTPATAATYTATYRR